MILLSHNIQCDTITPYLNRDVLSGNLFCFILVSDRLEVTLTPSSNCQTFRGNHFSKLYGTTLWLTLHATSHMVDGLVHSLACENSGTILGKEH